STGSTGSMGSTGSTGATGSSGSTGSAGSAIAAGSTGSASSLWLIIIEAMLWGFAALLTPCVFPMVPMTISFFMKGEGGESRGRVAAGLYGLFIVLLYTLPIGAIILITRVLGGDAVTADIFNWIATHWLPNLLFFVVFIVFALSFFGLFEITLPSSWVNRSDSRAGRGSLGGIFFLALTLVLVSFSCTGPIVGSVLIKSAAGEFWQPIITMLAFSVAFALPFVAVALSPALVSRLPKSGGWLGSVKVVLGFLELALALKFLSVADQIYHWGLLSRNLYLVLWIVIFSLLGLYLLGLLRIGHTTFKGRIGLPRLAVSVMIFSFVAYLATGLWGAALKPLSGYLPPLKSHEFVIDNDLETARKYAARAKKPILLDFTGYGCVNCREMEQRVWSDPRVERILREEYVVVALYMDDKEQLPESEWVTTDSGRVLKSRGRVVSRFAKQRYGVNSQPTYIPIGNDGEPLTAAMGYNLDIDEYIQFLQSGVEQYRKKY
ncbi:MAG: thioredoxin family protein, partial [Rikenellaceae bacterium]